MLLPERHHRTSGHATRSGHEQGFTLVEVLIAVALLATIAGLVSMGFAGTFKALDAVADEAGRDHQIRITLGMMADELVAARRLPTFPWIGRNGDLDGRPADIVAFVTAGHLRTRVDAPEGDMSRLLYSREGDRLIRLETRHLFGLTPDIIEQTELARGVTQFNVRYFDRGRQSWTEEWDSGLRQALPDAVLIELTLLNAKNEPRTFSEWVSIPPQS